MGKKFCDRTGHKQKLTPLPLAFERQNLYSLRLFWPWRAALVVPWCTTAMFRSGCVKLDLASPNPVVEIAPPDE
jgi:hypothetical protein